MKITKIEIRKLQLPMVQSFTLSHGEFSHKETIITSLYTDTGLIGYGESSTFPEPIFNEETTASCSYIQEHFIAPRVIGKDFATVREFRDAYADLVGNPSAQTGPEAAFWHLIAQEKQVSLKNLLGGTRAEIPVGDSVGIRPTIDETLQEIDQRLHDGYVRIKLKIKPGWDTAVLAAVRSAWPHIDLTADGNAAYHLETDGKALRSLDAFHLSMLEQPFATDNLADHATLQKSIQTPICLDESITNLEALETANIIGACKIVNIKPVRVGGLSESLKIYDYAVAHNLGIWCGGMFETGIGRAFNIALASKANFTYPADMSPYQQYFAEDLIEPSYVIKSNGHVDVPDTPGLGYTIRPDRIEKYTVQKITVGTDL
jgi:O-succinylbenzoate synthase